MKTALYILGALAIAGVAGGVIYYLVRDDDEEIAATGVLPKGTDDPAKKVAGIKDETLPGNSWARDFSDVAGGISELAGAADRLFG